MSPYVWLLMSLAALASAFLVLVARAMDVKTEELRRNRRDGK